MYNVIGFRWGVNGDVRGGGYQTVDISRLRCGMKYSTRITGSYDYRGFRCVKGVPRGSSMVTRAQYTRSAGWRNTDYLRRVVVDRVGFRTGEWCI